MSDHALTRVARSAAALGVVLTAFGAVVMAVVGPGEVLPTNAFIMVFTVFCAAVVWIVVPGQPRNRAVWCLGVGALCGGIFTGAFSGAVLRLDDPGVILDSQFNNVIPAELAPQAAVFLMIAGFAVTLAIYVPMTLGLLLFPDGRPPSPRWRWVVALAAAASLTFGGAFAWALRPSNASIADEGSLLVDATFLATLAAVVLSLAGLVVRFVRSREKIREQFKWVVWGASIFVPAIILASNLEGTRYEGLSTGFLLGAGGVFIGSYGVAIGRHRLFDVDVVISRTITYGVLATLLAAVYAVVVVGVGALLGLGDEPNLWLSISAIALIAVAFEPIRLRVARGVNRLVYGKRATPHEVLANLTTQLADSRDSEETMRRLAQLLIAGTGATHAVVWLLVGRRLRPTVVEPDEGFPVTEMGVTDLPSSDVSRSAEVRYGDELLGALTIRKPRNELPTEADERLLADVAAGAGLLLRNIRLNVELAERAKEVRASRRRLIKAHDAARHRLERDLHDGAQQQVVALKVKLGLARALAEAEAPDLVPMVSKLADETQAAVDQMRALAHGIYPPLLEAEGLGPALTASTRSVKVPVDLSVEVVGRLPRPLEETVYFCATELIGEAVMAGATRVTVDLEELGGNLSFTVASDAGLSDLRSSTLADRIEAADGTLSNDSQSGRTRWTVLLPLHSGVSQ